jgi:hypothetical protein
MYMKFYSGKEILQQPLILKKKNSSSLWMDPDKQLPKETIFVWLLLHGRVKQKSVLQRKSFYLLDYKHSLLLALITCYVADLPKTPLLSCLAKVHCCFHLQHGHHHLGKPEDLSNNKTMEVFKLSQASLYLCK